MKNLINWVVKIVAILVVLYAIDVWAYIFNNQPPTFGESAIIILLLQLILDKKE
ncbi:MAG: hypothetical protein K0Q53_99 [Massilibacillus sp.]|jgi:hypothetical protein|nr:hypothetical protein [Massilibacillus sp.]